MLCGNNSPENNGIGEVSKPGCWIVGSTNKELLTTESHLSVYPIMSEEIDTAV